MTFPIFTFLIEFVAQSNFFTLSLYVVIKEKNQDMINPYFYFIFNFYSKHFFQVAIQTSI